MSYKTKEKRKEYYENNKNDILMQHSAWHAKKYSEDEEYRNRRRKESLAWANAHPGYVREYRNAYRRGETYTMAMHNERVMRGEVEP